MTLRKVLVAEGEPQARHAQARTATQRVYEEHFIINSTLLYRLCHRLTSGITRYEPARHGLEVQHGSYHREPRELVRRVGKAASAARPSKQLSRPTIR